VKESIRYAAAMLCLLVLEPAAAVNRGQTATPISQPADQVVGSGNFSPMVADLDQTVAFYRDVLGLQIASTPAPTWDVEPWLRGLHGTPGSPLRFATARIPGVRVGVEMVEHKDIERAPVRPRAQDPGACTIILMVRDLDTLFARARSAGAPVITLGGGPINLVDSGGNGRAVVVKDPDGHFVELVQLDPLPATAAPATSNVIGASVRVTVADTDQTLHLYRDLLGVPFKVGSFTNDRTLADLTGVTNAQIRRSDGQFPGGAQYQFLEYRGVDRKPLRARVQDPGSTRFQLMVRDLDSALTAFKSTGGVIVSTGGEPVVEAGVRYALVRDLNNLFWVVWKTRPRGQRDQ
jgi:catechol 2,3-dioxygenase-like lactoylglutathione lyase family enzyme